MYDILVESTSLNLPPGVDFTGIFNDLMAAAFPFVTMAVVFMAAAILIACIKFAKRGR